MAAPNISFTVTGTGASPVYACDNFVAPFNIGYGTTISATATYSLQFTFDDIQSESYNPATGTWFTVSGVSAISTATSGSFTIPCRGMRLNVTASTGSVTVFFQQSGAR